MCYSQQDGFILLLDTSIMFIHSFRKLQPQGTVSLSYSYCLAIGSSYIMPALLLSIYSLFLSYFLLLYISLSYCIFSVPMCMCLGEHWCMSSTFFITMLKSGPYFFTRQNGHCFSQNFACQELNCI